MSPAKPTGPAKPPAAASASASPPVPGGPLAATLAKLPDRPGVYLMKDARGAVLYVGKAQSLRNRVRSYWQREAPGVEHHRIRSVIDRVADIEYTLTDSVSEALLLENNLIKRFQPPFNVRLKDDKSYPFIKVTLADDFPRIERTRKLPADGSRYFGPYASASSVDEAMNLVRRLFPFRTCTIDIREGERALQRPCLLFHIKRCQGPCIEAISKADYRADIAQVELFLEGRQESLARALRAEMDAASERTEYERAAALRDKLRAIERTMESQKMAALARTDLDLVGLARQDGQAAVQLFVIRDGKLVGRDATDEEVIAGFLLQYYARASSVPGEIAVPVLPAGSGELADVEAFLVARRTELAAGPRTARPARADATVRPDAAPSSRVVRRGPAPTAVRLSVPRRGERRALLELATRNAAEMLAREQARWLADQGRTLGALEELAAALDLPGLPTRIECYDISTIQGRETVGSMAVFLDGRPRTGEYRRFQVKSVEGQSDVDSHREVLRRRFRRARTTDDGAAEADRWAMPDLVVIDGGRAQVSAAAGVLAELGLHDLPLVGLAKQREELFLPHRAEPILLPTTSQALYLVQRLRDEAHRFAITFHRRRRAKASTRSAFDDLPGVGPRRRAALLRVFGSLKRVREAPVEQVAAVPGIGPALAARIKAALE